MAYVLANTDGSSDASAGDIVVTGGGFYRKNEDGTSTKIDILPTSSGTTSSYETLKSIYQTVINTNGQKNTVGGRTVNNNNNNSANRNSENLDINAGSDTPTNQTVDTTWQNGYDTGETTTTTTVTTSSGIEKIIAFIMIVVTTVTLFDFLQR